MGALLLDMRSDLRELRAQPYADRILEVRFNVNPRYGSLDDEREQTLARLQERLAAVPVQCAGVRWPVKTTASLVVSAGIASPSANAVPISKSRTLRTPR